MTSWTRLAGMQVFRPPVLGLLAVLALAAPARAWQDEVAPPPSWGGPVRRAPAGMPWRPLRPEIGYPADEAGELTASEVAQLLRGRGLRPLTIPRRRGSVYLADVVDGELRLHLVVDAATGAILRGDVAGAAPPAPARRAAEAERHHQPSRREAAPQRHDPPREESRRRDAQRQAAPQRQASRAEPPRPPEPAQASPEAAPAPVAPPAKPAHAAPAPAPSPANWTTPPARPGGEAAAERPPPSEGQPRVRVIEGVTPVLPPSGAGAPSRAGAAER